MLDNYLIVIAVFFLFPKIYANDVGHTTWEAINAYRNMDSRSSVGDVIEEVFQDLDDAEKIDDMMAYLRSRDKSSAGTPYELDFKIADPLVGILRNSPDLISDVSHLRNLIQSEQDPRDFFLITKIAMVLTSEREVDFSDEMNHMLLKKGKITNIPRGWGGMGFEDVSYYTYGQIVTTFNRIEVNHPFRENVKPSVSELNEMSAWLEKYHGEKRNNIRSVGGRGNVTYPRGFGGGESGSEIYNESRFYGVIFWVSISGVLLSILIFMRGRYKSKYSER